jgi:hypothetical protein
VQLEDLLHEVDRSDAAEALDRLADPGGFRAAFLLPHVTLGARQSRREDEDDGQRDDRADEDEPPLIAVVHRA